MAAGGGRIPRPEVVLGPPSLQLSYGTNPGRMLDEGLPGSKLIALIVACTVILSLVLHGMTANPLAGWIAAKDREFRS